MRSYDKIIRDLSKQVGDYRPMHISPINLPALRETKMDTMYNYSPYMIVPICTLILLFIFQPSIVMNINEQTEEEKVGYLKLLYWTIGISVVVNLSYFIYRKTERKM